MPRSAGCRPDAAARRLSGEIATLRGLLSGHDWATADPLGIGGLLLDAFRLVLLPDRTGFDERLAGAVLAGADAGLEYVLRQGALEAPDARRLAFRELGLAIGLQTLPAIAAAARPSAHLADVIQPHLASLVASAEAGQRIVAFWSRPQARAGALWQEHRDINEVMLAAALAEAYPETAVLPGAQDGG